MKIEYPILDLDLRVHHYIALDAEGNIMGQYSTLFAAADTIKYMRVYGGKVISKKEKGEWSRYDCLTLLKTRAIHYYEPIKISNNRAN